ncbi:MAG: type I restriction endonuclease subunit R [Caldilineaceae bacterium]|nr:type I restriction endonuclease subunit R [Caldilineaceae bacterium]
MSRINEKRDVQDQLINFLRGIHWTFIERYELPHWRNGDETQPFLIDVLRRQLAKLNGWSQEDGRIDDLVRRLRLVAPTLEGNEQVLLALRNEWTAYDRAQQREFNVTLIDYGNLTNNQFHFSEEVWFQDSDRRRLDVVLYINGLPVLLVENKSPKLEDPGLAGFEDVQETYTQYIPEFLKFPIPFAVCASRLEYGATWNPSPNAFYKWKVNGKDYGLEELAKSFFARDQVLRLLQDYALFYRMDDALLKFVLRPHQMRCIEKIVERVVKGQACAEAADTGLESHTQGSGKTLTMIVTARKLRRQPELMNPTLLMVVDRVDLETQMCQNLEACGLDAIRAHSRHHLQALLDADTRGVIVTTIHKFEDIQKDRITRRNVVLLVDEAHRSQEGDLGIYMRAALPNAFRFGFTGTPIDKGKVGRGTYEVFGSQTDPNGIHDQYTINESIEDGTTLPLYYTLAPTDIWVDRLKLETEFADLLEEFWELVDTEGAGTQEALSQLLQRADKLMAVLKAPQRIEAIATHIAEHFQSNVLPMGFKGMVVTPDREACALYKQALDRFLPPEWSEVVYSQNAKRDDELMRSFYLEDDEEKRIRKAFRDPNQSPKLLIVTQKLLTGFDAPIAYVMYLDKPLKDHTLLQAIARVNRPYPNKSSGLVVDYIGVFKDLQRALNFDQGGLDQGLFDLEQLRLRFVELLGEILTTLEPIDPRGIYGRTARIIGYFFEEAPRSAFLTACKDLQLAYEVLSPDPFLYDYIGDYRLIIDIFQTVQSYYNPNSERQRMERELQRKTEALISEHVGVYQVAAPMPLYPINRNIADVIAQDHIEERVKVINLQRSINEYINKNIEKAPYLATLGDEVEEVIGRLRQQQISAQTALSELQAKTEQVVDIEEDRANSTLDDLAFAIRTGLKASPLLITLQADQVEQLAQSIANYLSSNPGWKYNTRLESQVRVELYKLLLAPAPKPVMPQQVKDIVENLLRMHRIIMS